MKIWQIIVICFLIRLISLNQSLWLDEAISAQVTKVYSYSEIVTQWAPKDFHPPLYYLTLKAWTGVFGNSEISLRMPSVIFSLVTIYIVYLLAGNEAALLTGLNPLFIYYSQEARMYSMVTMLTTLAIYLFVKKKYGWFNVAAFLCFMTFYGSVFLLAALGIYLLINKKYKELIVSNIGIVAAIIILSPLLRMQMKNSQEMLLEVKNWSLVLGKANLKNLLLIPIKFTSGRIGFEPKILYYFIAGGWVLFVFGKILNSKAKILSFYSYLFWMSLLVGTVFSIFTPMMQYFRFLFLVPVMALIIGKNKVVATGFLIFSLVYLLVPGMWREDWKDAVKNLSGPVYMINSFGDPVNYYNQKIKVADIRGQIKGKEITAIPYGEEIHGVDHNAILSKDGYKKKAGSDYRGVTVETWQKI